MAEAKLQASGMQVQAYRQEIILFLGGLNLTLLQFLSIRNLPGFHTEGVLFLVVISYFLGYSAGCFISDYLGTRSLRVFMTAQWLSQLIFPFSLRWIAGGLAGFGADGVAVFAAVLAGSFWMCSFYSILLPLLLRDRPDADHVFPRYYGIEIAGAAFGMLAIMSAPSLHPNILAVLYQADLAAIAYLLFGDRRLLCAGAAACVLYAWAFTRADDASIAYFYKKASGIDARRILFKADTAYQRVEILDDGSRKYLFLDGFAHYVPAADDFNYFIAGLPVSLLKRPDVVIVGSGSFGAVRRALPGARRITSVELDPVVAEAGRRLLAGPFTAEELKKLDIVIDDAKHYFGNTARSVDLISLDITGPFQRQVALLYTVEFFSLLRSRLNPEGVIAVGLCGDLGRGEPLSLSIAQGLLDTFNRVYAVVVTDKMSPTVKSFSIAGDNPGFEKADIIRQLSRMGRRNINVYDRKEIEAITRRHGQKPLSAKSMSPVLEISRLIFRYRAFFYTPSRTI